MNSSKILLRQNLLALRKIMPAEEVHVLSTRICQKIQKNVEWQQALTVALYYPHEQEVNLLPLVKEGLRQGKIVLFPRVNTNHPRGLTFHCIKYLNQDFKIGYAGIPEPLDHCREYSPDKIDLIFVPGVAFDKHGNRLGRGKGCYDSLLATTTAKCIGVGYESQIVTKIPLETHDRPMHHLITEKREILTKTHDHHP